MTPVLAAVTGSDLIGYLVSAVMGGLAVAGIFDRRRKEVSDTWEDLAAARAAKVAEQDARIAKLEAKVDLLESDFVESIATKVAASIGRPRP